MSSCFLCMSIRGLRTSHALALTRATECRAGSRLALPRTHLVFEWFDFGQDREHPHPPMHTFNVNYTTFCPFGVCLTPPPNDSSGDLYSKRSPSLLHVVWMATTPLKFEFLFRSKCKFLKEDNSMIIAKLEVRLHFTPDVSLCVAAATQKSNIMQHRTYGCDGTAIQCDASAKVLAYRQRPEGWDLRLMETLAEANVTRLMPNLWPLRQGRGQNFGIEARRCQNLGLKAEARRSRQKPMLRGRQFSHASVSQWQNTSHGTLVIAGLFQYYFEY